MSRRPDVSGTPSPLSVERVEEIREQLERVLSSPQFRGSKRCQSLLRQIVEQTLAGELSGLKERTLGVDVFGRLPDYDTSQDPVVRATAAEVRKKLAQYYQTQGHESEPRLELLSGSYVAAFPENGNGAAPDQKPHPRFRILIGIGVAVVLALVLAFALSRRTKSDLDRLWAPLLKTPETVLICVGQPVTYNLRSALAQDAIQGIAPPQPSQGPPGQEVIPKKDLLILWDRYVALGDAVCLVRLSALFEKYGKPYRIRGERNTSFADLRDTPAVMIGAFDNQWTLRAAGPLRFTFVKDSIHETDMVRDRQHPDNTDWKLIGAWPDWDVTTDYAIVSRILDTSTDRPGVIAAGITQYGTIAAGEFLTNPAYFAEAVPLLPRGWEKKNLQIVLQVPVVNRVSGRPKILAIHVW